MQITLALEVQRLPQDIGMSTPSYSSCPHAEFILVSDVVLKALPLGQDPAMTLLTRPPVDLHITGRPAASLVMAIAEILHHPEEALALGTIHLRALETVNPPIVGYKSSVCSTE